MKIAFDTFGCRLNRSEALDLEARLLSAGHSRVETHEEAEVIVVRGCSVTRRAQTDCERHIAHLRRKYPFKRVYVQGCLPKTFLTPLPPALFGSGDASELPVNVRTARAYLKVQDGCNGRCTFCIVPEFRGKSVSVPFASVLDRARRFIAAGYRELVVTGCNLSLYASEGRRLAELLDALCALDSGCRVRLGSVEPGDCAHEVLGVMERRENLCRFLHLPIQSMSFRMLSAMGRPYRPQAVKRLLDEVTRRFPAIGLGADLMTGFPGEAELDHFASRQLLHDYPFSNLHVFPYSERPGTAAAGFGGAVPPAVRSRRAHELAELGDSRRAEFAASFVGKVVEAVIEDEDECSGWTGEYLRIMEYRTGPGACAKVPRKSLQRFRVVRSEGRHLLGVLLGGR